MICFLIGDGLLALPINLLRSPKISKVETVLVLTAMKCWNPLISSPEIVIGYDDYASSEIFGIYRKNVKPDKVQSAIMLCLSKISSQLFLPVGPGFGLLLALCAAGVLCAAAWLLPPRLTGAAPT